MEASAAQRPIRSGPRIPARLLKLASDERLVDLVRAGSEPAFEVVYDRHHRGILAFCRHMLGTAEEAEDAVQHTFMAAYRELIASDKRIHLRPWLYTIARNRCLTVLRGRRERPLEEAQEPATEHLAAVVQRRQDLRDLLRDLHELPDEQRAALVLAEAGDVSHEEIGEILDVPREKVKALVFQARSSLIASKQARETSCETIREQLVELKGGSLRRNTLRRHLKECAGCTEFRAALQHQRGLLALALPVVPSVALKQAVLGGTVGTSTAAAGATAAGGGAAGVAGAGLAGGSVAGGGASLTAKVLVVAAMAGGGGATAAGVKSVVADPPARPAPATAPATGGAAGVPDPTDSGPQAAGASPAPADPATGRPTAVSGAGAAAQVQEAPATSARPDAAPGTVKEEGASAKPDDPPGQVKDAPARPETAPTDQAVVDEKPAKAEKEDQPVTEEKPEKVKPESPEDLGSTPTTGKPAPGTGKGSKPETRPGQAPTKPAPVKSQRPASSGGGAVDEPLAAPAPSSSRGQGKSTMSGATETTSSPGNAGLNGNAGGNGKGRAVGLNTE